MNKIILIFLTLVLLIPSVFADTRQKPTTAVYTSSTLIKRGDAKIYRIEYIITSANGSWAIYDDTTSLTEANIKTEGSEATANNAKPYDFTSLPNGGLELSTGLYLFVNNANVVITYD